MGPELPTLPMQWDADFDRVVGMSAQYTVVPSRGSAAQNKVVMEQNTITFAGDESGERFGVVVTDSISWELERRIDRGERLAIGYAPLDGEITDWHMGLAAPGARPGKYWGHEGMVSWPAVALPLAAGGLRLWLGRRRVPIRGQEFVDKASIQGMGPDGELYCADEGLITGLTLEEIRRFCPGVKLVEPPR